MLIEEYLPRDIFNVFEDRIPCMLTFEVVDENLSTKISIILGRFLLPDGN